MTPERWQQIEELYHAALAHAPAVRAAFLQQACPDDEALRREVESLLAAHDQAASFIEAPPADIAAGLVAEEQARSMNGRTLGHYRIASLLGAGGMGEVYRARDTRLDRDVAVKILPEHLAQDAEALRRFEREAKAVAALSHPNITAIFDFGTEAGVSYAVMELLEGETLRARLQRGALPWREAVELASAIADGLAAAHAKGIIHRDLKPENIFLTASGGVKILDFGIARVKHVVTAEAETLASFQTTKPGVVLGTLGYMSPEQVRGKEADAPSDIFSLGCVLYEMVSGQRAFTGETGAEVIAAILKEEPPALTGAGTLRQLPVELAQIIGHCLEKRPVQRYQSARELSPDLRALLDGGGSLIFSSRQARKPLRPGIWLGTALVVLLLGAAVWLYWGRQVQAFDSLAVLPLVNASGDAETEYLSDGITEALINSLSQFPQLKRVIARSTVASYKNKEIDPRKVGQELNVRAVLTGKMIQRGNDLIIVAELVNTTDGARLWGDQYQRKLAELMTIQAEIAKQITDNLRLRLTGEEQQRLTKRYTDNPEAYQLYLKGRYYSNQLTIEGCKKGIELMHQAIDLDPTNALAYAGLADAYADASSVCLPANEALPHVKAAAEKALKLDDTLVEAHTMLAVIKANFEWNWAEAEKEFKRTIELRPSYARAHQAYGLFLMMQGRTDEAIAEMTRAHDLDPLTNSLSASLGWFYYLARRYDEALARSQQLIKLVPGLAVAHYNLGMIYEQQGKHEEAIAAFNQAQLLDPGNQAISALLCHAYASAGRKDQAQRLLADLIQQSNKGNLDPVGVGTIYAALGDRDQAFVWLEKSYQIREDNLLFLKVDPKFDSLRLDPRYAELLQRLNLSPQRLR